MGWREKIRRLLFGTEPIAALTQTIVRETDTTETLPPSEIDLANAPTWQRRYQPLQKLGEGGSGTVLLAERRSDRRMVCLKFLNTRSDLRAAEQECRVLMRLRHPSIVALLDFSLNDTPPWLAMEYVAGSTLRDYLKENGRLSAEIVTAILKSVLAALDYAHGEGAIHRDLKPANLMITTSDGGIKMHVLDFGIALIDELDYEGRITAASPRSQNPLGTLLYMAPEQLKGERLTSACDLYALGLIAWELLMGRSVFERQTRPQMMLEKVTRSAGFALEASIAGVKLSAIIEACTRPEPHARPNAGECLSMLQTV